MGVKLPCIAVRLRTGDNRKVMRALALLLCGAAVLGAQARPTVVGIRGSLLYYQRADHLHC